MTRQSVEVLRGQLKGHASEPYLLARQTTVDEFMRKYRTYFANLAGRVKEVITEDERLQLNYGNTGLVLKLEDRLQQLVNITEAATQYHSLKRCLETTTTGIQTLEQTILNFTAAAKEDMSVHETQAQMGGIFSLETFQWSAEKLATFSKKERRAMDPKTIINLRDRVIPDKQGWVKSNKLVQAALHAAYLATDAHKLLSSYISARDTGEESAAMYQATRLAADKMSHGNSSDGGFEKDILDKPELKVQWYPKLTNLLQGRGVNCDRLDFKVGHYYVVKHTKGSKTWYTPAEQDLILYDTVSNRIVAVGEVKANPVDIGHADYQLRRDTVMLLGDKATPAYVADPRVSEYLEPSTISDRYIAEKGKFTTKVFTPSDWHDPIRFIITQPMTNQAGRLQVSSKVATQISHWLYSSATTPEDYIQKKVDDLQDKLNFQEDSVVKVQNMVFTVSNS